MLICVEVICGFSAMSDRMASRVFCPPFLSTFSVHFGHCTALNGSGMGNNIGAIISAIILFF